MKNNNLRNELIFEIAEIDKNLEDTRKKMDVHTLGTMVARREMPLLGDTEKRLMIRKETLKWVLEKMDTPSKLNAYGEQRLAVIYVDKTDDILATLKKQGYDKRSGDASYTKNCVAIVLGKKWYWECSRTNREMTYDYF